MSDDPGSLANLRDLALPPAVSFWPPAPGIWILAAACSAMLAIVLWRAVERYRAMAYRRAAIAELEVIAAGMTRGEPATVEGISAVMKRVAMAEHGRERVASLSGEAWADFVVGEARSGSDPRTIRTLLSETYGARGPRSKAELSQLIEDASIWVRTHRKPLETQV